MAKIIIENTREQFTKIKLYAFIDRVRVGFIEQNSLLEIDDVAPGDYLLHVGFKTRKPQGIGVPFHLAEAETKTIQVSFTDWAWLAASWHGFFGGIGLLALVYVVFDFLLGFVGYEIKGGQIYYYFAAITLPLGAVIYPLVELWHRRRPRNFVKIEVLA